MPLRNRTITKILSFIIALYLIIAVLHGIAPGIWKKSFGGAEGKGPFRILMFTPLLIFSVFISYLLYQIWDNTCSHKPKVCYLKIFHEPYSRRGPPNY